MELKVFQVIANWTIFRIPVTDDTIDEIYFELDGWLRENCTSIWKMFEISHGIKGNSDRIKAHYGGLIEVDLLEEADVVAFKLRWL